MYEFKKQEEKILAFLSGRERTPTTLIARFLGIDYYIVKHVLYELEKRGLVKRIAKGRWLYWVKK